MTTSNSYVSIQTDIHISSTKLEECSPEALSQLFQMRSGTIGLYSQIEYQRHELAPAMRRLDKSNADLAEWLAFMQRSIEAIAATVSDVLADTATSHKKRVSLSAMGMEMNSEEDYQPGNNVQLVLELPPSKTRMMVIACVSESRPDSPTGSLVNFEFKHIRESDQEVLIRHIHQAQIEELRQIREQRDQLPNPTTV